MAKKDKSRAFTCKECGGTGYIDDAPSGTLKPGVYKTSCPNCAASFTVQVGARRFEGRIEGASSKDVSDVVRSILESKPGSNVTVSGSTIGVLNTGEIDEIKDIAMNLQTITGEGSEDLSKAIKELTAAIAESDDLAGEAREECLALVQELSKQAALPKDERSHRSVLRSVLSGLATTLGASGGLAETWTTWGPTIKVFFGL